MTHPPGVVQGPSLRECDIHPLIVPPTYNRRASAVYAIESTSGDRA
jgi:hypothetical protein